MCCIQMPPLRNYRKIMRRWDRGSAFGLDDVVPMRAAIGTGLVLFFERLKAAREEAVLETLPTPLLPPNRKPVMSTKETLDQILEGFFGTQAVGKIEDVYDYEDDTEDTYYVVRTPLGVEEASKLFDAFSAQCSAIPDIVAGRIWLALEFE